VPWQGAADADEPVTGAGAETALGWAADDYAYDYDYACAAATRTSVNRWVGRVIAT
jgi:hypothetical protein